MGEAVPDGRLLLLRTPIKWEVGAFQTVSNHKLMKVTVAWNGRSVVVTRRERLARRLCSSRNIDTRGRGQASQAEGYRPHSRGTSCIESQWYCNFFPARGSPTRFTTFGINSGPAAILAASSFP